MAQYWVTYQSRPSSGFNRRLITRLNALGGMQWMSAGGCSAWMLETEMSASQIAQHLGPTLEDEVSVRGEPGNLCVIKIAAPSDMRTWGLAHVRAEWMNRRLKAKAAQAKAK